MNLHWEDGSDVLFYRRRLYRQRHIPPNDMTQQVARIDRRWTAVEGYRACIYYSGYTVIGPDAIGYFDLEEQAKAFIENCKEIYE